MPVRIGYVLNYTASFADGFSANSVKFSRIDSKTSLFAIVRWLPILNWRLDLSAKRSKVNECILSAKRSKVKGHRFCSENGNG